MGNLLLRLLVTVLSLYGVDYVLPNLTFLGGWENRVLFAIVLGILNWLVKPILVFFSIPFIILTIGLFYFLINALILFVASKLLPGMIVATNGGILLGSILISFFHWALAALFRVKKQN